MPAVPASAPIPEHMSHIGKLVRDIAPPRTSCKKNYNFFRVSQKVSETCSRVLYGSQFDRKWIPRSKIRRSYGAVAHQSRNRR